MSILVSTCISYHLTVNVVLASNSTSSEESDATMKALLTVGILLACLVIALVVAKIVDSCYDHHIAINDNASDISEDTRKLVRLRLAVNALGRIRKNTNDSKAMSPRENQRRIIRIWSARAKESRRIAEQRRAETTAAKQSSKSIIKVEEAMAESKITTATVAAAALLTVSESPSKRRSPMLTPQTARAGIPSPITTSRSVSVSPHKPEAKRKVPETSSLSPRAVSKSSQATLQVPQEALPGDVQRKVVSGVGADKTMAGAAVSSSAKKVRSGNQTVEGFGRGVLDSCGDDLTIELGGEDPETYRSAVDLGQDSVRSEAALDLVALSCRSDIKAFPGSLLQGLDTSTQVEVVEQETSASESLETGSVKPDPSHATVSPIQTSAAATLSQDSVVDTRNTHSSVKEAEEEEMLQPSRQSLSPSTPDTSDTAGMIVNSTTTTIKDSNYEPGNHPENSSQENPTSPTSREIFTITLPTEQRNPDTCKLSQQTGDSENKRGRSVERAMSFPKRKLRGKARPLSFSVKDMTTLRRIPPQLAESVRLYTGVRGVFNLRKGPQGSKKTVVAARKAQGCDSHPCSVHLGKGGEGGNLNNTDTVEEVQNHSDKF